MIISLDWLTRLEQIGRRIVNKERPSLFTQNKLDGQAGLRIKFTYLRPDSSKVLKRVTPIFIKVFAIYFSVG